jgi:hypothetical protein
MTAQRTDDELTAWLRAKQLAAVIPSTAAEYGDEIDRLLAEWVKARP